MYSEPRSALAVKELLTGKTNQKLVIELSWLSFSDQSNELLCQGIASSTAYGVRINSCVFSDDVAFGRLLLSSPLKFISLAYQAPGMATLMATILTGIKDNVVLTHLEIDLSASDEDYDELHHALLSLLGRTVQCACLQNIKIAVQEYCEDLDETLVNLVRSKSFDEITISCLPQYDDYFERRSVTSPLLLQTFDSNYSITNICFDTYNLDPDETDEMLPTWDATFCANIATLTRLNREGRGWLASSPSDTSCGVQVLISVSDDLDCLYFHLRECPDICFLHGRDVAIPIVAYCSPPVNQSGSDFDDDYKRGRKRTATDMGDS